MTGDTRKPTPITTNGRTYTAEPFPDEQPRAKPTLRATIRAREKARWKAEAVFVATVLSVVVLSTGNHGREWIGAAGVIGSFLHAQVSDRLAEHEAARATPGVDCHRMATVYFVAREIAWFTYFATGRCWSALVGCGVFLVYPLWRRWWRAHNPLATSPGNIPGVDFTPDELAIYVALRDAHMKKDSTP